MNASFPVVNHSTTSSSCKGCFIYHYNPYVVTLLSAISFLGMVANALLLVAQKKDPLNCFKNASSVFIHHIAISDFLTAIGLIPTVVLAVLYNGPLFFDSPYLPMLGPFLVFFTIFSALASASLAFERFTSVAYTLRHQVYATKWNIRFWIGALWITAIVVSMSHMLRYLTNQEEHVVEFVVLGASLGAIIGLNTACFFSIKRQQKAFRKSQMADLTRRALQLRLSNERCFLTTIFIVSMLNSLSWIPGFVMMAPSLKLEKILDEKSYKMVSNFVATLFMANPVLTPLLYVWRLPKYRKTFKMLYCTLFT